MEIPENTVRANNLLIKQKTKITIFISLAMILSVVFYASIAIFISNKSGLTITGLKPVTVKNIFNVLNLIAILMVIIVLAIRKSIYYSERFIKDDFTLVNILDKWKSLDIVLLALGESISVLGLVITFFGVPFSRSFHFFVTSILVILIIMPVNWKVRDKLKILEQQRDFHFDF